MAGKSRDWIDVLMGRGQYKGRGHDEEKARREERERREKTKVGQAFDPNGFALSLHLLVMVKSETWRGGHENCCRRHGGVLAMDNQSDLFMLSYFQRD